MRFGGEIRKTSFAPAIGGTGAFGFLLVIAVCGALLFVGGETARIEALARKECPVAAIAGQKLDSGGMLGFELGHSEWVEPLDCTAYLQGAGLKLGTYPAGWLLSRVKFSQPDEAAIEALRWSDEPDQSPTVIRYDLERSGGAWRIAKLGPPTEEDIEDEYDTRHWRR